MYLLFLSLQMATESRVPSSACPHARCFHSRKVPCAASPPRPPGLCSPQSAAGWPEERCPAWGHMEGGRGDRIRELKCVYPSICRVQAELIGSVLCLRRAQEEFMLFIQFHSHIFITSLKCWQLLINKNTVTQVIKWHSVIWSVVSHCGLVSGLIFFKAMMSSMVFSTLSGWTLRADCSSYRRQKDGRR